MQFQSFSLNTNARMYLYNTPRDTMAKDPMFQSLCSTSTWNVPRIMPNTSNSYFPCALELMLNTNIKKIMCSRACAQHIYQMTHVLQSSCSTQTSNHSSSPELTLNTKSHQSCASGSMPNTYNRIHAKIKHMHWLTPNICKKSSYSSAVGSYTQYTKYKHQRNIICNGTYAHWC